MTITPTILRHQFSTQEIAELNYLPNPLPKKKGNANYQFATKTDVMNTIEKYSSVDMTTLTGMYISYLCYCNFIQN